MLLFHRTMNKFHGSMKLTQDCSLSGSSVHGTFQARVLEWIAISFYRVSSRPRNRTLVSCIAGRRFTVWATREALIVIVIFIIKYLTTWVTGIIHIYKHYIIIIVFQLILKTCLLVAISLLCFPRLSLLCLCPCIEI